MYTEKMQVQNSMSFLKENDVLNKFVGKMFWVWDGNHRLQAWRSVIDKHHFGEVILAHFQWILFC